jgi:hypothetical protein
MESVHHIQDGSQEVIKRFLVLLGYRFVWWLAYNDYKWTNAVHDWYYNHVYGPWYDGLPDACDDCDICLREDVQ